MDSSLLLRPPPPPLFTPATFPRLRFRPCRTLRRAGSSVFRLACAPVSPAFPEEASKTNYRPGAVDDLLLKYFRQKMVDEVEWDSRKPGYDGLMEVVNRLMKKGSTPEIHETAVRVLISLFPPLILDLYQSLIAPIGRGKLAALMLARATALSCQWLMGRCSVNAVDLPDGTSSMSGVFVERCKYLEESKCVGVCINTCKFPTQKRFTASISMGHPPGMAFRDRITYAPGLARETFFHRHMGVPLLIEPNFSDYSCQIWHVEMRNRAFHCMYPKEISGMSASCIQKTIMSESVFSSDPLHHRA